MATPSDKPPLSVLDTKDLDSTRPLTDPKHYRLIKLSNGLEALLISDPRISASSGKDLETHIMIMMMLMMMNRQVYLYHHRI